jgi:hypothetical protein
MRKLVLLIISGAMLAGGLCTIIFELLLAHTASPRFVVGAGALAFAGAYLMWTDFIAPRFGVKTWED